MEPVGLLFGDKGALRAPFMGIPLVKEDFESDNFKPKDRAL